MPFLEQNHMPETLAPWYDMAARMKHALFDSAYPLASPLPTPPFFIIGSGRCGSTLLRRMLQAGDEVHIPPETYVLGEVGRLFMRNRQMDWKYLVNMVLSIFEYQPEFDTFHIRTRDIVQQLWHLPEQERSLAMILDMLYRFHGEQTGQRFSMWGDKTPKNTFELDMLIRIFPQAKFIHLLRDGVDVAASFAARGLMPDVLQAAEHWQRAVLISRDMMQRYPEQCLEVRYENLVEKPQPTMQALCSFLGITFHNHMIESREHTKNMGDLDAYQHYEHVLKPVSVKHIGQGRNTLSEQELQKIRQAIGDTLVQTGYSL